LYPAGRALVLIAISAIVIESLRVAVCPPESDTLTVNGYLPAFRGAPDNSPDGDRLRPGGSFPEARSHEYESSPPSASSVAV
jgi:hypothetical protein